MAVKSIQLGQVWSHTDSGKDFLITKLYNEVFSQYAILRPADSSAAESATMRIKVSKSAEGATLPGFTFTQDSNSEF